jgi:hypothetical protein
MPASFEKTIAFGAILHTLRRFPANQPLMRPIIRYTIAVLISAIIPIAAFTHIAKTRHGSGAK